MTERELFLFDLQGYVVIEDVLTATAFSASLFILCLP